MTSPAPGNAPAGALTVPGLPDDVRARPFVYPGDLEAMAALVAEVNAFDRFDYRPGPELLAVHWRRTDLFDPGRDCVVVEDGRGWAAMVSVDPQVRGDKLVFWTEGWVRPDRRREGIGRALLAWAEGHAAALVGDRAIEPVDLPGHIGFGILESNPAAVAFANAVGYPAVRYGFIMRRPLDAPILDAKLPEGLEIRPVRPEHHRAIWAADIEAFRDHFEPRERGEDDFAATFHGPHSDTSMWRVAWAGDEVAGSVINEIDPGDNARIGLEIGWLEHVSVRRPWRGRGVARALIVESLRVLRERGMAIAALGVDAENPTGALGLYERLGFAVHETWVTRRRPLAEIRTERR